MEHMTVHPETTTETHEPWRALPWMVAALTLVGTGFALLVSPDSLLDNAAPAAIPVLFAALGVLIAVRRPGNRIAWLFLLIGPVFLVEVVGWNLVADHPEPPSFWDVLTLAGINSAYFIGGALAFLVIYLFPTGRFLTRRWSVAGWLAIGLSIEVFVVHLFLDTVGLAEFPGESWSTSNPIGFIPSDWWYEGGPLQVIFGVGLLAVIFGAIPAVVVRWRRSSQTVRAQIKWVTLSFVVFVVLYAINLLTPEEGDIWGLLSTFSFVLIPVVITVAIVQYRLFDIDRIISRTIGYTIVVALLAAAFLALTALITSLLPTQNSLAVAASTLAVAALFNPLRKWIQTRLDRRFNRSAYEAELIGESFATRLSQQLTTDQIVKEWQQTVGQTLQPATSGVWIKSSQSAPANSDTTHSR